MKNTSKFCLASLICFMWSIVASAYDFYDHDIHYLQIQDKLYPDQTCLMVVALDGSYGSGYHYKGDVVIPSKVNNCPVTAISDNAFYYCKSLTSISLPNSINSIGADAFRGCTSLKSIEIPNSVTNIGMHAFAECSLLETVKMSNSVTSIEDDLFYGCSQLNSITIPETTKSIGERAFRGCKSLRSILIPNSVQTIGREAFWDCSSLSSVKMSNTITNIQDRTFQGCKALETIDLPNSVTSIGDVAFGFCENLTTVNTKNVIGFGRGAFASCSLLNHVDFNKVEWIGEMAFDGCSELQEVILPEGLKNIFNQAFRNCSSLSKISLPYSLSSIGSQCFDGCNALEYITLQNFKPLASLNIYAPTKGFNTKDFHVSSSNIISVDKQGKIQFNQPGTATITVTGTDVNNQPKTVNCNLNIAGYPVKISSVGYATFSAPSDYSIPEKLKAGSIKVGGNLAKITYYDASHNIFSLAEAVVLKGEPGTYFLPTPLDPSTVTKDPNNDLKPVYTNAVIKAGQGNKLFVFAKGRHGLGFYYQKGCPDGSQVSNLAGKAYLELPVEMVAESNGLRIVENEVSGIEHVDIDNNNTCIYSLTGIKLNQTVDQLTNGIYIINGKKIIVK